MIRRSGGRGQQESIGMDVIQHGEEAYVTGEGAILVAHEEPDRAVVP